MRGRLPLLDNHATYPEMDAATRLLDCNDQDAEMKAVQKEVMAPRNQEGPEESRARTMPL